MKIEVKEAKGIRAAENFPARLEAVHEGRIILRDTAVYKGAHKHIDAACTVCGHEWSVRPNSLVTHRHGCPACASQRKRDSQGTRRSPRASAAEKEFAKRLRNAGLTWRAIGKLLKRSDSTIRKWVDPIQREVHVLWTKEYRAIPENRAQGRRNSKLYRQTAHGAASSAKCRHSRRGIEYHCIDSVLIDNVWHDYNIWDLVTTAEDREFMSFPGADEDVSKRKKQQLRLAKISGEPYSLEHLIPLSRGGIHHPFNFANRALELNLKKNNNLIKSDTELFARRLFNL